MNDVIWGKSDSRYLWNFDGVTSLFSDDEVFSAFGNDDDLILGHRHTSLFSDDEIFSDFGNDDDLILGHRHTSLFSDDEIFSNFENDDDLIFGGISLIYDNDFSWVLANIVENLIVEEEFCNRNKNGVIFSSIDEDIFWEDVFLVGITYVSIRLQLNICIDKLRSLLCRFPIGQNQIAYIDGFVSCYQNFKKAYSSIDNFINAIKDRHKKFIPPENYFREYLRCQISLDWNQVYSRSIKFFQFSRSHTQFCFT